MPPAVVVGNAIQHHGDKNLDVEDGEGLRVDGGVLGLVRVKGGVKALVWFWIIDKTLGLILILSV